jgi:hypothetical protein
MTTSCESSYAIAVVTLSARICIDLLSILSMEHAEVVAATVTGGDNS